MVGGDSFGKTAINRMPVISANGRLLILCKSAKTEKPLEAT